MHIAYAEVHIIFAWAKRGGTKVSSVLIIRVWKKGKFANFDIFAHKLHNVVKIFMMEHSYYILFSREHFLKFHIIIINISWRHCGHESRGFLWENFSTHCALPAKMSTFSPLGRKFCINGVWIIMTYFSPST